MCLTIFCMFLGYAQLILMNLCKIMHTCTCPHRSASLHYWLGPRICHSWSQCWCCCGYVYHHLPGVLLCWSPAGCPHQLLLLCEKEGKNSGQPHPSPSEGPQPTPLYDEVGAGKLELKENVSYGPVDTLEMKRNPSYGPVRH